jgi:enamine deaminase RidA (YjgF/YER057c/UK114 family)
MSAAPEATRELLSLEMEFQGADAASYSGDSRAGLRLPLPHLGGDRRECTLGAVVPAGESDGFRLFAAGHLLIGYATRPIAGSVEACTFDLYGRLMRATAGRSLYRVWNYLPDINRLSQGFEHYRAFSAGRARAFEAALGAGYWRALPAASAVGCQGGAMALVFVAGTLAPKHFENPEQIPAYHYPLEHGPRSPSFARATVAAHLGRPLIYISGTSAIKGHETVAPGSTEGQIECALDNLRLIAAAAGVGDDLGARLGLERHFKVYLRHASDLSLATSRLGASLLRPGDHVVWLQADLCRAELNIEIEATLRGRQQAT